MPEITRATVAHHRYENMAFLADRETAEKLEAAPPAIPVLTPAQQLVLESAGYTRIVSVSISEDDEQEDDDIKVFVCVTLEGTAEVTENEVAGWDLEGLLDEIADQMLFVDGVSVASTEDSWEVADIEDPEDAIE